MYLLNSSSNSTGICFGNKPDLLEKMNSCRALLPRSSGGLHRAQGVEVKNRGSQWTTGPIGVMQVGGLEVLNDRQIQFLCQNLDIANSRKPGRAHIFKALHQ